MPRWLDARLIAGLLLVVTSIAIGARVVAAAQSRTQVVAFTRDLAAGTTIRPGDVSYVRVNLPTDRLSIYADQLATVQGRRLTRPVERGELATRASVDRAAPSTRVVLPLVAGAAPALSRGDRVVVWAAADGCALGVLVGDATVQGVDRGGDGAGLQSAGSQRVTLDLPDDVAARVVATLAKDSVTLRAGVLQGGAHEPIETPAPTVPATSCKG